MSRKCPKNVQKLSGGTANTIFGHILDIFCLFGRCFCLVTLSNARPLQICGLFMVLFSWLFRGFFMALVLPMLGNWWTQLSQTPLALFANSLREERAAQAGVLGRGFRALGGGGGGLQAALGARPTSRGTRHRGEKTSQHSCLLVNKSNCVPDNWVYRLPIYTYLP